MTIRFSKLTFVQIDQAMVKVPSTLCQLKNSLAPINRLPPEVLALVPAFRDSEKDLINATAVCKYWRRTFVSTPDLWTNLSCSERASTDIIRPRINAYFARSGAVPVNVQMHAHASRLLSPYTGRISRLTLFIDGQSDIDEISKRLSKPAPLLETITLRANHRDRRTLALPPRFFEGFLSSARTLILRGLVLSPGPCPLSKLTKFTLNARLARVTATALLDTLEQMPLLRIFEAHLKFANQQDPVSRRRVVTLPYLEEIAITMHGNWFIPIAGPILPALRLPRARRVVFVATGACNAPFTPILPLSFKDRLPRLSDLSKASAAFDDDFNVIKFFGPDDSELKICTRSHVPYAFTEPIFGGVPFDSVRRLWVSFRGFAVDTVFFVNLLRSMRGLERLKMIQDAAVPLASLVGADEQASMCPALSTLIVDADINETKRRIKELKQVREGAGVPIANVEIRQTLN